MSDWLAQKVAQRVLADEDDRDIPKTVKRYVEEHKEQGADESKAWALAWSRYCVAGDTLVCTSEGVKTVKDLYNQAGTEEIAHSDGTKARRLQAIVTTHRGWDEANYVISTGEKPVVDVETKHNYRLTCTPDHKILVLNESDYSTEWIPSEEAEGRYAVLPSSSVWGDRTKLPEFSYERNSWNNSIPPKQPEHMTHDLARILGYLVSEGGITEEGVGFSNTNKQIIQDYTRAIKDLFGECPEVEWRDRAEKGWKDCGKVRLRTRWYSEFFSSLGLTPGTAHDKSVPEVILHSPKEYVVEFLKGFVEGDGYMGDDDHLNKVDLATASDTLANQLHLLLLNLGIPTTFETNQRGYHNIRVHSYDLVKKYENRIGSIFKSITASDERQRLRGSEFTMIPAKALLDSNSRFRTAFPGTKRVGSSRVERNWDVFEKVRSDEPDLVENMQNLLDRGYYFDKITSVQDAGTQEVYDLSIPEDSSFVANGLLAHNCKYKYPNSPHCKKDPDEYFSGRDSSSICVASRIADSVTHKTMVEYVDIDEVKHREQALPIVAGRVASRVLQAYRITLPSTFHDTLREYVSELSQTALRPFPTNDPEQYKHRLISHVKQELNPFLPEDTDPSEEKIDNLISDLLREGSIELTSDLLEKAYVDVIDDRLEEVDPQLVGQVQGQFNNMTEEVADDESDLPSIKNAVRLLMGLGVSENEAQRILDLLASQLEVQIPFDGPQIDSLINSLFVD